MRRYYFSPYNVPVNPVQGTTYDVRRGINVNILRWYILYIVVYMTLYYVHRRRCALYNVHYIVIVIRCTVYKLHLTVYNVRYTVYSALGTMYNVHCTLYIVQYTVRYVRCIMFMLLRGSISRNYNISILLIHSDYMTIA